MSDLERLRGVGEDIASSPKTDRAHFFTQVVPT